ncbi:DUF305 domain-containing protein [Micromonospora purpureochromogenes]|uniref:DUF305 domain-containing protein n=1 Tax=Micromonospora purpureochromogenes TaxID=47872 RepID=UPI0033E86EB3
MAVATHLDDAVEEEEEKAPTRSRLAAYRAPLLALTALLVFTLGYGAGVLAPPIRTPDDASAEAGFARDMSRHHAQAVEMAMIAYADSPTPEIRQVAYDMALTQQNQIGQMQRWLQEWQLLPTGSRPAMAWMPDGGQMTADGLMPGMATNQQIAQLREAKGAEVDRLFLDLMIKHHLGGIHMIDEVLDRTDREEVTELAGAMKRNQQQEVTQLREYERQLS